MEPKPEYYLTLSEILLDGGRADLALPNAKFALMAAWNFDPCKKLAGEHARVTYMPRAGKAYDGEISSIQLLK